MRCGSCCWLHLRWWSSALLLLLLTVGCTSRHQDINLANEHPITAPCATARINVGMAKEMLDQCIGAAQKDPNYQACGDPRGNIFQFKDCVQKERCFKEAEDYMVSSVKADLVCSSKHRMMASR